ncbi:hypothetical protein [Bradyrhizobium sp. LA2.1]|uniref:hypothetical protein n=1 Tax=Bradyrhizobium sp. LA2.1 TaxID=3156376 RepID=UPI0033962730
MTSDGSRTPSGGIVIIGSLSPETQEQLAKVADCKIATVSGAPQTHVLETTGVDLRRLSERVNKVVGTEGVVAPILADDEGNRLLPTGRMQVRFKEAPTDKVLQTFAKKHKVAPGQRNKWSPQQAEFAVRTDDTRYFPDVAAEMEKDSKVATAWPDVRAAFRREST